MSWSDSYPILTDDMLDDYEIGCTGDERQSIERLFTQSEVINEKQFRSLTISTSVFWELNVTEEDPNGATENGSSGQKQANNDQVFSRLDYNVEVILEAALSLSKEHPDVVIRVYLADDPESMVEGLIGAGCEVVRMTKASAGHSLGTLWRLLAIEDTDGPTIVTAPDRLRYFRNDIERTFALRKAGLECWRVPSGTDGGFERQGKEGYRPISSRHFGVVSNFPLRRLLCSFIWHNLKGNFPVHCVVGSNMIEIKDTRWLDYGFDEWFLATAMFPRLAEKGLITFLPWKGLSVSPFLVLDIEFAMWMNDRSEVIMLEPEDTFKKSK